MPAISAVPRVTGAIGAVPTLHGSLGGAASLRGSLSVASGYAAYGGPYEVTPRLDEQVLDTSQKLMRADVTVLEIPRYRTTNLGGGYTVVIAQD